MINEDSSSKVSNKSPCPKCKGEITSMFGLAGGGNVGEDGKINPGVYWICLDCDWMESRSDETLCFPFGLVEDPP
jgi:hypothetical protein